MEAATKRNTQQAADPQRAERANKPKWSSDHMSRFLSAQRGSVIKSSPRFIKLALLAELHNQQLLFQNNLQRLETSWRYFNHNRFGIESSYFFIFVLKCISNIKPLSIEIFSPYLLGQEKNPVLLLNVFIYYFYLTKDKMGITSTGLLWSRCPNKSAAFTLKRKMDFT